MTQQMYTDEQRLADINIAIRQIDELRSTRDKNEADRLAISIYKRCDRIGNVITPWQTLGQIRHNLVHRREVETRVFGKQSTSLM